MGDDIEVDNEKYSFTWNNKNNSIKESDLQGEP